MSIREQHVVSAGLRQNAMYVCGSKEYSQHPKVSQMRNVDHREMRKVTYVDGATKSTMATSLLTNVSARRFRSPFDPCTVNNSMGEHRKRDVRWSEGRFVHQNQR